MSYQQVTAPPQVFLDEHLFSPTIMVKERGLKTVLGEINNRRVVIWDEHGKQRVIRSPGSQFIMGDEFPPGTYRLLSGMDELRVIAMSVTVEESEAEA